MLPTGGGKIFGPKKFSGVGENFFANLGVGDGLFEPKGGVKRILLKGELKIFQQRGAKLPLGHTLNWGVQMKKISFGGGKKNFSYGILNTCPRMTISFITKPLQPFEMFSKECQLKGGPLTYFNLH